MRGVFTLMSSLSWEKGSMSFLTALRILCSDRNRWQSSARQHYEGEKARSEPASSCVRGRPTVQKHEVVEGQQPLLQHMRLIRAHLPKNAHQNIRNSRVRSSLNRRSLVRSGASKPPLLAFKVCMRPARHVVVTFSRFTSVTATRKRRTSLILSFLDLLGSSPS